MLIIDKFLPSEEDLISSRIEISKQWKNDCDIDGSKITSEILKTYNIHSKYLNYLMNYKDVYISLKKEMISIRKIKTKYYKGEMGREELAKYSLEQYQGVKPIKSELENLLGHDEDVQNIQNKIITCENIISMIEYIITQIGRRSYDLKTLLDGEKFYAGN